MTNVKIENCKILEFRTGSQLYGTETPLSDQNISGIFIAPEIYKLTYQRIEVIHCDKEPQNNNERNRKATVNRTFYEIDFFFKRALENSPNILEMLFVNENNVLFASYPFGTKILENAELFPHIGLKNRYIGYAKSEKHKLISGNGACNFKRASHIVRILTEAIQFADHGKLEFPLPYADVLLDIKLGKYPLKQVLEIIEDVEFNLEDAFKTSRLSKRPRIRETLSLLRDINKEYLGIKNIEKVITSSPIAC